MTDTRTQQTHRAIEQLAAGLLDDLDRLAQHPELADDLTRHHGDTLADISASDCANSAHIAELGDVAGMESVILDRADRRTMLMQAALMHIVFADDRPPLELCEHLTTLTAALTTPSMMHATTRHVVCRQCVPRWQAIWTTQIASDTRCDVCLAESEAFFPLITFHGGMVIAIERGACCAELFAVLDDPSAATGGVR